MMKLCAMFASLIALSASAFAADYPVLTPAQPDTVGFNVKKNKQYGSLDPAAS